MALLFCGLLALQYILPNFSIIPEPAKTADMVFISSQDICREEDFWRLREKEAIKSGGPVGMLWG
jgi:hypothetical protein